MKRLFSLAVSAAVLLLAAAGCEKNPGRPDYRRELTVFGYLRGGERLTADRAIWIAYTRPITEFYEASGAALVDGDVTLADTADGAVVRLREQSGKPGYYFNDSLTVLPKHTYRLRIEADGKTITAETTVPPVLETSTTLRSDTVNVVKPENISRERPITLSCEDPDQIILVDLNCNETYSNAEYIHPFLDSRKFPENREEYDGGVNREPKHIMVFARLRNFVSPDNPGQTVIFWYSAMFVFYGSSTLEISAIDDNFHRILYKEHPELEGGINGGIGVFGSMCSATFKLLVVK